MPVIYDAIYAAAIVIAVAVDLLYYYVSVNSFSLLTEMVFQ